MPAYENHDEFDRMVAEFTTQTVDPNPYGIPANTVKTGLTPRGKVALTFCGAALAASCVVGWQISSSNAAEAEQKALELALKRDQLEVEKLKVLNQASTENAKTQATLDAARQKKVDACVTANKGLVGKQLGATYRSVVEDCQAQYGTTNTSDMLAAGSATSTPTDGAGGGDVSPAVLLGGAAIAAVAVYGLRKGRRNPA